MKGGALLTNENILKRSVSTRQACPFLLLPPVTPDNLCRQEWRGSEEGRNKEV